MEEAEGAEGSQGRVSCIAIAYAMHKHAQTGTDISALHGIARRMLGFQYACAFPCATCDRLEKSIALGCEQSARPDCDVAFPSPPVAEPSGRIHHYPAEHRAR